MKKQYKSIIKLSKETAGKIAAGEVIERPASVVRELMDNAIDAGASKIFVEIEQGGIASIRISDDGNGMTKEDLEICTQTHTTSKIENAEDLLSLDSLGFRGEALASIQAVSDLEIISTREGPAAWKLSLNTVSPARYNKGTSVEVKNLFENFPARKKFLKRSQYEAAQCRQIFIEKALPHYDIEMRYFVEGTNRLILPAHSSLKERCLSAMQFKEPENLFYEIYQAGDGFEFSLVLGSPAVVRSDKRNIYIFVNGRRINDYGFIQAINYGAEGYFPNGGFPIAFLFLKVDSSRVDFNIHPAKKEAKFEDYKEIHHSISSTVANFFKQKTVSSLLKDDEFDPSFTRPLGFSQEETAPQTRYDWSEKSSSYDAMLKNNPAQLAADFQPNYFDKENNDFSQKHFNKADNGFQDKNLNETGCDFPHNQFTGTKDSIPQDIPKPDFKFLGQFCGTFIAVEKNDALYIIDQHATHERIIFEELKANLGSSQELLIPYKIETESEKEDAHIRKNLDNLKKLGFHISEEKKGMWIISAVPIRWKGCEKDLYKDIIGAGKNPEGFMHDILASTSCRAACKDGDILDPVFAYHLAVKAFSLPEPLCPHGRPIFFIINRDELFKRVKRT